MIAQEEERRAKRCLSHFPNRSDEGRLGPGRSSTNTSKFAVSKECYILRHIKRAFDRVWYKSLVSKLPGCRFCFLFAFISDFLSGLYVYCCYGTPINIVESPRCFLSSTLFLFFIMDLTDLTRCRCPIRVHSHANDFILIHSTSFLKRVSKQKLYYLLTDATKRLTPEFSIFCQQSMDALQCLKNLFTLVIYETQSSRQNPLL